LHAGDTADRIHDDRPHEGQVDHEAPVDRGPACGIVPPAAHGNLETERAPEMNGVCNIGHAAALRDERRPLVNEAVVKPPGIVVRRIAGSEDAAGEAGGQVGDVHQCAHGPLR
jgi:hypothetical protein